jgi:hypothetical protein
VAVVKAQAFSTIANRDHATSRPVISLRLRFSDSLTNNHVLAIMGIDVCLVFQEAEPVDLAF